MQSTIRPAAGQPRTGWIDWLFSGRTGLAEHAADLPADAVGTAGDTLSDPVQQARAQLMGSITQFLVGNGLGITNINLQTALRIHDGSDTALARQVSAHIASGKPVTQAWLDELTGQDGGAERVDLETLMVRLENNLEMFSRATADARKASASYGRDLEDHVSELLQVKETGEIVANLANLAKAMLERTRAVEAEMRRSETEARSLRRNLEKARRDAEIDHLTGLPNRRAFEGLLAREYREAKAAIEPLSVAFCDIDHFKAVNDQHGHEVGDRVIRAVAEVLANISDERCHAARHGGEEFVILFRGKTVEQARAMLDETREALAARRFVNRKTDEAIGRVTFSAGLADVFAHGEPGDALAAADRALYCAKQSGRNRIEVAS